MSSAVVSGAVARRVEYGGHVWALLHWVLGLRRLGWDVLFLDRLDPAPGLRSSRRVARFVSLMERFGLRERYSLDLGPDEEPVGLSRDRVLEAVSDAEFLLNVMGYLEDPELLAAARRRVFLDIDPGFPQMWDELGYCAPFEGHDAFLTVGSNLGRPSCGIPSRGRRWIPVHPPVATDLWPASEEPGSAFTGVGSWRGPYDPVERDGERYGLRVHEFRKFADLPRTSGLPFAMALDIAPEDHRDRRRLEEGGWRLLDPSGVAAEPEEYARFVRGSRAEFQVAKNMYVRTRSGWLSDRTACYLASGRPALVQDTGLEGELAEGWGLVTFSTPEEALEGARRIQADWPRHARAARELAEEHFAASRVMARVVEAVA